MAASRAKSGRTRRPFSREEETVKRAAYWLGLTAAAAALSAGVSQAQNYPVKTVRFIVTYPAGGSSDAMARIIGAPLTEMWGQQVIVDSRPGAAGAIGMEYAAKQPPDGYTFLLGNFGPVVANPLLQKVNYDAKKDFIPVSQITSAANILVVPNAMPVKSVKELVALCRARPGQLVFATSGAGSMSHLAGEMFKRITSVKIEAVAYKGGSQSIADLMGGHIPMMFSDAQPVMANIKSGKLRALAVTSEKRTPLRRSSRRSPKKASPASPRRTGGASCFRPVCSAPSSKRSVTISESCSRVRT
jgi:tripartite-type tricarboxylate transporter receptor subunit TctC